LRSGIGSGSVGKEGGRIGLSISFTDISASSRMRFHSYKRCDDCAVRQWAELRLFVRKSRPSRGDFDGQKLVCLCEVSTGVVGTSICKITTAWWKFSTGVVRLRWQKPVSLCESLDRRCGDFDR
jgi:hypothetical protein